MSPKSAARPRRAMTPRREAVPTGVQRGHRVEIPQVLPELRQKNMGKGISVRNGSPEPAEGRELRQQKPHHSCLRAGCRSRVGGGGEEGNPSHPAHAARRQKYRAGRPSLRTKISPRGLGPDAFCWLLGKVSQAEAAWPAAVPISSGTRELSSSKMSPFLVFLGSWGRGGRWARCLLPLASGWHRSRGAARPPVHILRGIPQGAGRHRTAPKRVISAALLQASSVKKPSPSPLSLRR